MYYVYKIKSCDGYEYIGQTNNLKARTNFHKRTKPEFTGKNIDVSVLGEFSTREEALIFETEQITDGFLSLSTTLNNRGGGGGITNAFAGKTRPEHSKFMKGMDGCGTKHLNVPEIRNKSKLSRQTKESRTKSKIASTGNTNVRGRKWYNNGKNNFMLYQDDSRIDNDNLQSGRINYKRK